MKVYGESLVLSAKTRKGFYMSIRMSIARCCCGEVTYTCNPEGITYQAGRIITDSGITVDTNYSPWYYNIPAPTAYPWSPAVTWVFQFFGYAKSYPQGTFWDETSNDLNGRYDFDVLSNSFSMYSNLAVGFTSTPRLQTRHHSTGGTTSGGFTGGTSWNPCDKNTLNFSFEHSHDVNAPSGGWGSASSTSSPTNLLKIQERYGTGTTADFLDIQTYIDYDRVNGTYDHKMVVTFDGVSTNTYTYSTSSSSSAAVDIALKITPVAPTITSPVRNRWKIEFDVTADGTALSIPDYEFHSPFYGSQFQVAHEFSYACDAEDHDKYNVADVSISTTNT